MRCNVECLCKSILLLNFLLKLLVAEEITAKESKMMWLVLFFLPLTPIEAAKYHQTDYTVKVDRVEVINPNRSYLSNLTCGLVHYNRTYRAVNFTLHLLKDLDRNLKVVIQIYKFLSNEYRFFPITIEDNACTAVQRDFFGIYESLEKSVNIPLRCPIKRGWIKMTYGMIDFSKFPPYIPGGEYKAEAKVYDVSTFIAIVNIYAKVEEVLKKWEV